MISDISCFSASAAVISYSCQGADLPSCCTDQASKDFLGESRSSLSTKTFLSGFPAQVTVFTFSGLNQSKASFLVFDKNKHKTPEAFSCKAVISGNSSTSCVVTKSSVARSCNAAISALISFFLGVTPTRLSFPSMNTAAPAASVSESIVASPCVNPLCISQSLVIFSISLLRKLAALLIFLSQVFDSISTN